MMLTRALLLFVAATSAVFGAEPANPPGAAAQTTAQAPAQVPAVPTMGRLFFSVPERAALDDARLRPPVAVTVIAPAAKPLPPAPEYVMLNGVVRRSDGSTAVWLNNRMLEGRRTAEGLEVTDSKRAPGAANVTVRVPQAGRSVDLRVGQRLDVTSGQIQERYQVAPPPAAPEPGGEASAPEPSASAKSPPRRSRERERRDPNRDMDWSQPERPQPAAQTKG